MPTSIYLLFTLALFVGNSAIAAPSPLTARDLLDLKALYESNDRLTIIGERYGNGSAGAEVYWPIKETNFGTCFSHYVFAIGDIVEGRVEWEVPENRDVMTRAWVKQERDDQPCSELLNQPTILLRTPIEEQTLLRLYRSKGDLALEASAFVKPSRLSRLSPAQIENARLEAIRVDRFRDDRTNSYRLEFTISQCSGLSADVV